MKNRKHLHCVSKRHLRRLASARTNRVLKNTLIKYKDVMEASTCLIENNACTEDNQPGPSCSNKYNDTHMICPDTSINQISFSSDDETNNSLETEDLMDQTIQFQPQLELKSLNSDLASWAVKEKIPHSSLNNLLKVLKCHGHDELPADARTLLSTPRNTILKDVQPGFYWHAGLRTSVINKLSTMKVEDVSTVELAINVDGLPLSKSSGSALWPILASIVPHNDVFLVGAYHGSAKPKDANDFLLEFVNEIKEINEQPITIAGKKINLIVKYFVCDSPAKSFILHVKGHNGYSSCTKCTAEGSHIENRICFNELNAKKRTDSDFRSKTDEEYHTGVSILEDIPSLGLVSGVPLDYMHLVCLGVTRKLLHLWTSGDLLVRLQGRYIKEMSESLERFSIWIPKEFARKPRSLLFLKQWKATEFRQFLLYTGPVVLKRYLKKNIYKNFLTLSLAIRILCNDKLLEMHVHYAEDLLRHFVQSFAIIYGDHHVSHNVHGLIHLAEDTKQFGKLDNFSAFPFENYLQSLKRLIRKSDKPLQQLSRRYIELEKNHYECKDAAKSKADILNCEHFNGPLPFNCSNPQFKKLITSAFVMDVTSKADQHFLLENDIVVLVKNIATSSNHTVIIGHEYLKKEALITTPCNSEILNIYKVSKLSNVMKYWPAGAVICKCVALPMDNDIFAIFPLLHTKDMEKY